MSYVTQTKPEAKASVHQKYAKLRTEVTHKNALLRSAYEKQANQQLKETVKLEQEHFQKQVDETVKRANELINQANAEANHWREQVEIIYALLEDTTQKAEVEIARLSARIAELKAGQPKVKKPQNGKPKPKRINPRREVEQ